MMDSLMVRERIKKRKNKTKPPYNLAENPALRMKKYSP